MPIKVVNIIVDVRVDRAAAHVGNHVQLISRGLHPLGYGLFVLLHLCNIVQIYVQTIYDMLRYQKL